MGSTNGNGRIHLLGHQSPAKTKAEQQTADEQRMADRIAQIAAAAADTVVQHYMAQVPGAIAMMLAQILKANGFGNLKPPPEWSEIPAIQPKALDDAPSAGNVPTDAEGVE